MSKRIPLLVTILILGLTGFVKAQDPFNWSGFYIGGNIGGDWLRYHAGNSGDTVTEIVDIIRRLEGSFPFRASTDTTPR